MKTEKLIFSIENSKKFNAVLDIPANPCETSAIISHGANNDIFNPLLEKMALKLCNKNIVVLRFNFPYRYENRKSPDTPKVLKSSWLEAYNFMKDHPQFGSKNMITIGKSLGGRISSELCAEKKIEPKMMVFLGYPMHAPGKLDQTKDEHLYNINSKMLFLSGTKDPLCNKDILKRVDDKIGENSFVYFVDGGGHSLALKGMDKDIELDHYDFLTDEVADLIVKEIGL